LLRFRNSQDNPSTSLVINSNQAKSFGHSGESTLMSEKPEKGESFPYDTYLKGTTNRLYRYLMKHREPVGISQVQAALRLSSSSVSEYHIKKLLRLGLVREEKGGYVVDRVVISNIVRIRRVSVPVQADTSSLIWTPRFRNVFWLSRFIVSSSLIMNASLSIRSRIQKASCIPMTNAAFFRCNR
jgi:predicted DNA-binding transcriptional regulator